MFRHARGEMDNTPYDFSHTLLQPVNLQDTEVGFKDISFPSYPHVNHGDYQWIITKDTMMSGTFHGEEKMPVSPDTTDPRHKARWLAQDRILWFSLARGSIHTVKEALQHTLGQANKLFYDNDDNYDSTRDCLKRQHRNNLHARWWCIVLQSTFGHPDRSSHTGTPKDEQWSLYHRSHALRPSEIMDAVQGLWQCESIGSPFGPSRFLSRECDSNERVIAVSGG